MGDALGAGERGRQDDDSYRLCAGGRRLHRPSRGVARRMNGRCYSSCSVKAPSTLGTFLRKLPLGPRPPAGPGRVASCWHVPGAAGAATRRRTSHHRPGLHHQRNHDGLAHSGLSPVHGYTGQRGYHPLLAVAAGTGDVLMARLREGRANTARGAAHFLRETVGRVRHARGHGTTHHAGRQRFRTTHGVVLRLPQDKGPPVSHHHPQQRASLRKLHRGHFRGFVDAHPPIGWRAPPMWPRTLTLPSEASPMPRLCRLIVSAGARPRPGPNWPSSPPTAITASSLHRDGVTLDLEADHRCLAETRKRHPRPEVRRGDEPSPRKPPRRQRRLAGSPADGLQPGTPDGAHRSRRAEG